MASSKQSQSTPSGLAQAPSASEPSAPCVAQPDSAAFPDFSEAENWGQGGRFIVNDQGQRVPAPIN